MEDLELLLQTLRSEFQKVLQASEADIPRHYEIAKAPEFIQVIMGMRRSGKTRFVFQEIRRLLSEKVNMDQILYVNFEDDRLLPMTSKSMATLLDTFYVLFPENHQKKCYLFLDEIQNVDGWEQVVRRFQDTKSVKIVLTGSSSKMLSKEIATSLRGRTIEMEMWPFSFHEYLQAKKLALPPKRLAQADLDFYRKTLINYFQEGGFPAIHTLEEDDRHAVLQGYVNTVVYRDIIERHRISNTTLIKYLVKTLLKLFAAEYSPNKLYNDLKSQGFKVSKDSVYDYIHHIEDAFLSFTVSLFSESLRKTQVNPKKVYAVDNGLVNAYTTSVLKNYGKMLENQVYLDLRRKGHKIYYYKTQEGYEIDFLTRDPHGKLHAYQVVWDTSDAQTLERETRALKAAEKELGIKGELVDLKTYFQSIAL